MDTSILLKKVNDAMTKAKYKAFGKVTVKRKPNRVDIQTNSPTEEKLPDEVYKMIDQEERRAVERDNTKLKQIQSRKGKAAAIFKLKEKIV